MTPKEKAQELLNKFYYAIPSTEMGREDEATKQCALIAVDEVMSYMTPQTDSKEAFDYWREVKQELEKI